MAALSRVSQKICLLESLLSVRFITKLLSKEVLHVSVSLAYFLHASLTIIHVYTWAFRLSHKFVYTPLDSFVNLHIVGQLIPCWLEFGIWQVWSSCLIERYKHFGNGYTGCRLFYGGGCLRQRQYTVNSEMFAKVLISRNFACAKFRENKNLAKRRNHSVVYWHRLIMPLSRCLMSQICLLTLFAKINFSRKYPDLQYVENVSDWLSYADEALIKVADSAGSTVDWFEYSLYAHANLYPVLATGSKFYSFACIQTNYNWL